MGRIRNRIVNTLGVAPRTAKTVWRTTIDTTKSALNLVLDPFIGLWKTWSDIKQAIHKSFTEWRWYQKIRNITKKPLQKQTRTKTIFMPSTDKHNTADDRERQSWVVQSWRQTQIQNTAERTPYKGEVIYHDAFPFLRCIRTQKPPDTYGCHW